MKIRLLALALFFALCLAGLFLAGCGDDRKNEANLTVRTAPGEVGERMSLSLNFLGGGTLPVRSQDERLDFNSGAKATLFVFFTTWCEPCLAEIPHLNKLGEKYKDLKIIALLLEDKAPAELEAFVKRHKIAYAVASGDGPYELARALGGVSGIPTMFLFGGTKQINTYLGLIPEEMLEIDIQRALL